jgi:hypothetical protein
VGGVSNETVKYGLEFCGTLTQEGLLWQSPETIVQQITDPSFRQRGRYKITNMQLSEGNFEEKEKLVTCLRWAPDTGQNGRLIVGRKLTSTSTSTSTTWLFK